MGNRYKDARTIYNKNGKESVRDVYLATGLGKTLINEIECDSKIRDPRISNVVKLASHYGVSVGFLDGTESTPTVNAENRTVQKYTGLSELAINQLRKMSYGELQVINKIIMAFGD